MLNVKPMVSVFMITYNHEKYIAQAIDSILMQKTNFDFEIVIGEDCSTDNTRQILISYRDKYPDKIKLLLQPTNIGARKNQLQTLELCNGKYIAPIGGDDYWTDNLKLQKQFDFLENNSGYSICFTKTAIQRNEEIIPDEHEKYYQKIMGDKSEFTTEDLLKDNFIAACSVMYSREKLILPEWYADIPIDDWAINILLSVKGKIKYLNEIMTVYRVHDTGVWSSKTIINRQKEIFDFLNEMNKHLDFKFNKIVTQSIHDIAVGYIEHNAELIEARNFWEGQFNNIKKQLTESESKLANFAVDDTSVICDKSKGEFLLKSHKKYKSKKRILLALPYTVLGGADTILLKIFRSLSNEYEIIIITTHETPVDCGDTSPEFKKFVRDIYHLPEFFNNLDDMKDFVHYLIESREIDLIFIVGSLFIYTMLPEIKERHSQVKVVDQLFNEFGHIESNRRYRNYIDFNICANKVVKQLLINSHHENPNKCDVIIHGVDVENEFNPGKYSSEYKLPDVETEGKFVISYFGRFSEEKSPDVFVEIISKLRDFKIQALMTGKGPMYNSIKNLIKINDLENLIHAPGIVDDIKAYMLKSDVVIVPSRIEGLPIVVLEALSFGIPVIASNIGGIYMVVKNDFNGYLCKKASVDDFVEKIKILYDDRTKLSEMKKNAREFAVNNISEDIMNDSYKGIIHDLVWGPFKIKDSKSKSASPLVSVIIPCYNYSKLLEGAVNSILHQSFQDFEIIIVDDGSTDRTRQVCDRLVRKNYGVISAYHRENQGPTAARRFGIDKARGKYIVPLDPDDQILPTFLEKTVNVLENNPKLGVAYVDIILSYEGGDDVIHPHPEYDFEKLKRDNFINTCSLIRKAAYDEAGGYDVENWGYYEDWDLFLRLGELGWYGERIPEPLFWYRHHFASSLSYFSIKFDIIYKAFLINKHPALFTQNEIDNSVKLLSEMPAGWNTRPPMKDINGCIKLLQQFPNNRYILFFLGLAYYNEKKYFDAIKTLSALLDIVPNDADAVNVLKAAMANFPNLEELPSDILEVAKKALIKVKNFLSSKNSLVSVIIPTFNRPEKLPKAIESVLAQRYSEFEIIVVNDAGEDVKKVIDAFKDERIKLVNHKKNKGLAAARNTGIKAAKGKYIALLDDDDVFYSNHLQVALSKLDENNKVIYTDAVRDTYKKDGDKYILMDQSVPYSIDYDRNKLLVANIAPVNCFVFEKSLTEKAGFFNENLKVLEDWDFWLRLSSVADFLHIKENTVKVNWFNDGTTMTSSKQAEFQKARQLINKKYEKEIISIENGNQILSEFNEIWQNDSKEPAPLVSVIALSYNQVEYTKLFVESLFANTNIFYELILIDNNSDKATKSYLSKLANSRNNLKVIFNTENVGFPKGINQALRNAAGKYIVVANNDIILTQGWLERMIEVAEIDSKIGIVGPTSNIVSGVQIDKDAKYKSIEEMPKYAAKKMISHKGKMFEFPRVAFLCTLIKRELINKIGGLDERFSPGNFEDDDFCLRAQMAGYKTMVAQDVFIHHFGSKSFRANGTEDYLKRLDHNKQVFINKWGADPEEIWLQNKPPRRRKINIPVDANIYTQSIERAMINLEDNDFQQALIDLTDAISNYDLCPKNNNAISLVDLYNLAGNTALVIGEYEKAKDLFEKELDMEPNSSRACLGLGDVFAAAEMYVESKTMLEWSLKNDPLNDKAFQKLIEINKASGCEPFNFSIPSAEDGKVKLTEAEKYIENSNTDEAEKLLVEMLSDNPFDIDALNDLSVIKIMNNDNDGAIRIFERIIIIDPLNEVAGENMKYLNSIINQNNN